MNLRIAGETSLNKDAKCEFCGEIGKRKGVEVEIIQDLDTNIQYASFSCDKCHERNMLRG